MRSLLFFPFKGVTGKIFDPNNRSKILKGCNRCIKRFTQFGHRNGKNCQY